MSWVMPPEGLLEGEESLRILLVEDAEPDAAFMLRELEGAGIRCTSQRVDEEAGLRRALHEFAPDVILSDHSLPQLTARDVLRLVQQEQPSIPVIIVTGSLDEETAADYIKAGAADYVVKHRLYRLGPAVRRAVALRRALEDAMRAEAARARSEQRFRKLIEYSTDVITLLDAEGRILYSSQSIRPTLGYGPGEKTGESAFDLVHPDDRPTAEALFRDVLARVEPVQRADLRVRHKDGSWRDLEVIARNHLDDPVVEAIIVNYHDVTERKRAEAAFRELEEHHRQAQKMEAIGRLASGVAHDFNNVLTVITTFCDLVLDDLPPDAGARPDVLEIRQAADRATKLTRQLLAFSRQQAVSPQRVDLNSLVGNMTGMLRRLLGGTVTVSFAPSPQRVAVVADPGQLERVVMNLAVNARDAMPQGGRLTLETRVVEVDVIHAGAHAALPGTYVLLAVSDTGAGMDADTKAHLFEPFFTTKPKGKGTGLGLASVYGIVQQASGFIEVQSEAGKGSTFLVYLPRGTV